MTIPPKVILIWTGTNASIPTGFTRVTALDSSFAKGAHDNSSQNQTGGSDTHSHTSPAHSHQVNGHTHTYDLDYTGTSNTDDMGSGSGHIINPANHAHFGQTSDSGSTSFSSSDSLTYANGSSLPPYYSVIFIKSNGYPTPTNAIALFANTTLPTGWNECNGLSSTPDLRNKYLRGATTGNDAGTTGGALTHSHDMSHSHTSGASHSHSGGANHGTSGGNDRDSGSGSDVDDRHGHNVTLNAATAPIAAYSGVQSLTDTVEPLYKKLRAMQKDSTPDASPVGLIGLFIDNLIYLPAGWAVCDGTNGTPDMRDYHLKIANDGTEIGNTGGSDTHTHAATSHSHTNAGSHSHSGSSDGHPQTQGIDGVGGNATARNIGGHNLINCSSSSPDYASTNTTADAANNEPSYLTAVFVQFQKFIGGAVLENIM